MAAGTRRVRALSLLLTVLAASALPAGTARGAAALVRVVVGGTDQPEELQRRIQNLIGPAREVRLEISTANEIAPGDLFGADDRSQRPPAIWILVSEGAARVRAADGPRQLFVFRDLAVATPLAELDRERIAQVANAALAAVLDRRPGALDRAAAARLLGAELPRPPEAPPPPPVVAAPAPPPAPPPRALPPPRWTAGISYEVQADGRGLFQGPGLTIGLRLTRRTRPPILWVQGQAYLPVILQEGSLYAYVLRLVGTLPISRWADAGLGVGLNYTSAMGGDGPLVSPSGVLLNPYGNYGWRTLTTVTGRLLVRGGPISLAGFPVSATASLDLEQSLNSLWTWYQSPPWRVRPAIALELWWR